MIKQQFHWDSLRQWRFILLFAFILFLSSQPVLAHGYLVRSIPADRSQVERAPARLQYWFSEALEAQFSSISLYEQNGTLLASAPLDEANETLLSLRVPPNLPDGAYRVDLRLAFASDGHVLNESRFFFVGAGQADFARENSTSAARPLEIIWKALLFHASYLLFGTTMLYSFILVPVWGNRKYAAGLLAPRLMQRLNFMILAGIITAVMANSLALMQQTMIFFGVGLDAVLNGALWDVVRSGTRFGDIWQFRMLVLVLILALHSASLYFREQDPKTVRSFWMANTWLVALFIGAQAVNSHAAGSLVMTWIALVMHWLHTLAVAFWVGGIFALVLILPVALKPYQAEKRWQALAPVMRRFSRYVVAAVLLVITTGIYNSLNWFFSPNDLKTTYGTALAYKLLMVSLLLLVGLLHHLAIGTEPRLTFLEKPFARLSHWVQGFKTSLQVESLLALLTLIFAALLSATPIPVPDFAQVTVNAPRASLQVADYQVDLNLSPGGTGINSLDMQISQGGQALENALVEVQVVYPQADKRSAWLSAETAGNGLYILNTDFINVTGLWRVLIDINGVQRVAVEWDISSSANVLTSLAPSPLMILAAFAVLVSFLAVLRPSLNAFATRIHLTLGQFSLAILAIFMTVALLGLSFYFVQEQEKAIDARNNPPPQVINPILADAESLALGESLYLEHCLVWQTKANLRALLAELDFTRDETLYRYTEVGWRDLPPCTSPLTALERWQIVNYLRSLRRLL